MSIPSGISSFYHGTATARFASHMDPGNMAITAMMQDNISHHYGPDFAFKIA
jgi:hypothetical protein